MNIKKVIAVCIFIFVIIRNDFAQSSFQKCYSGIQGAAGWSVKQTNNGEYVIFGNSAGFGLNPCYYLVRLNQSGDTIWTRAYCDTYHDYPRALELTDDGGFLMTGYSSIGSNEITLLKSDSAGMLIWSKRFEGIGNDIPFSLIETFDNGFIFCGFTESFGHGNRDLLIIKLNSLGDTLWTKVYGGSMNEAGRSIEQTIDSGFIITGYGFGLSNGFYILKIDQFGNTLWSKTYSGSGNFDARRCLPTRDCSIIIMGTTTINSVSTNVFLIKTDSLGDTLLFRAYGGADYYYGESFSQSSDSGFAVTGEMMDSLATSTAFYLLKVDQFGNVKWNNTFNVIGGGVSSSVESTLDDGFVVCGGAHILDTISDKIYFIKTDSTGYTGCHEEYRAIESSNQALTIGIPIWNVASANFIVINPVITTHSGGTVESICTPMLVTEHMLDDMYAVYPNPAHEYFTIENKINQKLNRVEIINSYGHIIRVINFESKCNVDCSFISKGIYLIRMIQNNKIYTRKISVM